MKETFECQRTCYRNIYFRPYLPFNWHGRAAMRMENKRQLPIFRTRIEEIDSKIGALMKTLFNPPSRPG